MSETMSKTAYVRTKPHLNIGTMGHVDHGKTTLTAAITKVLSERGTGSPTSYVSFDRIDRAPAARLRIGRGTNAAVHSPYATPNSTAAPAPLTCGGQPSARSRCGSYSTTVVAALASTTASRERRDQGESRAREQRSAREPGGRVTGSSIRGA
jgi:hypothetical protein